MAIDKTIFNGDIIFWEKEIFNRLSEALESRISLENSTTYAEERQKFNDFNKCKDLPGWLDPHDWSGV